MMLVCSARKLCSVYVCVVALLGAHLTVLEGVRLRGTAQEQMQVQVQATGGGLDQVITILGQMLKDFDIAMLEDRKNWDEYRTWSEGSEQEKNGFVQKQEALVMSTTATMSSNQNNVQKLTEDLAELASEIQSTQVSIKELVDMRRSEHEAHEAQLADLTKTLAAVIKATEILQGREAASQASLVEIRRRVQIALTSFGTVVQQQQNGAETGHVLLQLLQRGSQAYAAGNPDFLNTDGSKYETYEKKGGGVIEMLGSLRTQLENQKQVSIEEENEARRQYEETKAAKEADLKAAQELQQQKTDKKAECEAVISQCQTTIQQANLEIGEAKKFLQTLLADRDKFQSEFDERTKTRNDEMAATQAALDVLRQVSMGALNTVEGGASAAASFLQLQAVTAQKNKGLDRRGSLKEQEQRLLNLGRRLGSQKLVQASTALRQQRQANSNRVQQEPDEKFDTYMNTQDDTSNNYDAESFAPVIKLLRDLITRLEEEAAAEEGQQEWCETEKTTTDTARTEREGFVKDLRAEIASLTTVTSTLKSEIEFLISEITRVETETQDAIALRAEEKKVYDKAKADHEEVIGALETAVSALSGQYALLQTAAGTKVVRQAPGGDSPFGEYQDGGSGAASAMELLQDLLERYTEAETELVNTETAAVKAHEDLLAKNEQFRIDATNNRNSKTAERRAKINRLKDAKLELRQNMVELHEASKYLQDLRPSCDDIRSTFEERKKRREAEIAALKEALEVISDPSMQGR